MNSSKEKLPLRQLNEHVHTSKWPKASKPSFGQIDKSWHVVVIHYLSSRKGYGLFASDKRTVVKLLTVGLFSVGMLAASLLVYQELVKPAKPSLISKDEATRAAIGAHNWDEQALRNMEIDATLLHVRENGFSFVVDQNTLRDTLTLDGHMFPEYQNRYLWVIEFTGTGNIANGHWETIIDASNSDVLIVA